MKRRPVVFDLDGTLIDSRGDIAAACNFTLERAGRPLLPEETIVTFVGDGASALVRRAFEEGSFPELAPESLAGHLQTFLDYYTAHPITHTFLLPGVQWTLGALSDRLLAVCTNKARRTTLPVLEGMGLSAHFRVIVAGGDCANPKPAPDMLQRVAEQLGVSASDLVMVGDGPQDILAARAVGAHAVGVQGGLLPPSLLVDAAPDVLLPQMGDLPAYLASQGL